jgi:uncharacterized protein YjhX (UPF0386 family)
MQITIDLRSAYLLLSALRPERIVNAALDAGATAAYDLLQRYPPRQYRPNPPRSARQRRLLHALAREGKIPYRRTGNLRQKLIIVKPSAATRVVANTASYRRHVWGHPQAAVHAGVWPTVDDAREAAAKEMRAALADLVVQAARGG